MGRDITEAGMHDGNAPLAPMVRAPALGTWEFDLSTQRVSWSASLEEIHGIPQGSFEGTFEAYQRDIHPEDRERVLTIIERNLRERRGHALFYRIVRPDGGVRWLDARGEFMPGATDGAVRLLGVCTDVTDMLAESKRRTFLADVSRALAATLDWERAFEIVAQLAVPVVADWCAVDVFVDPQDRSRGLERLAMAHVAPEKVAFGREMMRRYPPNLADPGYQQMFTTREPLLVSELTAEMIAAGARDETYVADVTRLGLCSFLAAPIEFRGVVVGILTFATAESKRVFDAGDVACVRDLCGTLAVALANARLYREAQDAARAREDLVGIVSHDLRTPLGAILLAGSNLLRRDDVDDRTTATARRIVSSAERAARLVKDLLDFSQARQGEFPLAPRLIDIADVVQDAVDEVQAVHPERSIAVSLQRLQGQWDRDRLQQVFVNLVANAVEHSPAGSRVQVKIRSERDAVVEVHNEGPPIPPELHERIFEPFSRGRGPERESRGLGLGLYISSRIVRAHGGRIRLEAGDRSGNTFIVQLPR